MGVAYRGEDPPRPHPRPSSNPTPSESASPDSPSTKTPPLIPAVECRGRTYGGEGCTGLARTLRRVRYTPEPVCKERQRGQKLDK